MKIRGGGKRWRIVVAPAGVKFFGELSHSSHLCLCVDTHTREGEAERLTCGYEMKKRFGGREN